MCWGCYKHPKGVLWNKRAYVLGLKLDYLGYIWSYLNDFGLKLKKLDIESDNFVMFRRVDFMDDEWGSTFETDQSWVS